MRKPIARWKFSETRLPGQVTALTSLDAAGTDVVEEALVEGSTEAVVAPVGVRPDHVDVGRPRMLGADEADEEADDPPVGAFGDPRRLGEVLEPQAG